MATIFDLVNFKIAFLYKKHCIDTMHIVVNFFVNQTYGLKISLLVVVNCLFIISNSLFVEVFSKIAYELSSFKPHVRYYQVSVFMSLLIARSSQRRVTCSYSHVHATYQICITSLKISKIVSSNQFVQLIPHRCFGNTDTSSCCMCDVFVFPVRVTMILDILFNSASTFATANQCSPQIDVSS